MRQRVCTMINWHQRELAVDPWSKLCLKATALKERFQNLRITWTFKMAFTTSPEINTDIYGITTWKSAENIIGFPSSETFGLRVGDPGCDDGKNLNDKSFFHPRDNLSGTILTLVKHGNTCFLNHSLQRRNEYNRRTFDFENLPEVLLTLMSWKVWQHFKGNNETVREYSTTD